MKMRVIVLLLMCVLLSGCMFTWHVHRIPPKPCTPNQVLLWVEDGRLSRRDVFLLVEGCKNLEDLHVRQVIQDIPLPPRDVPPADPQVPGP